MSMKTPLPKCDLRVREYVKEPSVSLSWQLSSSDKDNDCLGTSWSWELGAGSYMFPASCPWITGSRSIPCGYCDRVAGRSVSVPRQAEVLQGIDLSCCLATLSQPLKTLKRSFPIGFPGCSFFGIRQLGVLNRYPALVRALLKEADADDLLPLPRCLGLSGTSRGHQALFSLPFTVEPGSGECGHDHFHNANQEPV